MLTTKYM